MRSSVSVWFDPWYNKYAVMVLTAVAGLFAYEMISWSKLTASDWATWFAAIGTIATFTGTIWLATRETANRRRDELQVAQLHAAAITFRLIRARNQIDFVNVKLQNVSYLPGLWDEYHDVVLSTLEEINLPQIAELIPMTALPGGAAAKLAAARGQIEHAIEFIAMLDKGVAHADDADPTNFSVELETLLSRARVLISAAIKEAQAARKALGLA